MIYVLEMKEAIAVRTEGLKKKFEEIKAVDGVSLQIPQGILFGLLGPNGAGKTTLVRMITSTLKPTEGEIYIQERSMITEKAEIVRHIGVCPQENIIFDELSAEENVIFVAQMHGLPLVEAKTKTKVLLDTLGIGQKRQKVKKFSGGMKRRLSLAMSLVHEPEILFLDEPTAGLDPQARRVVWDFIRNLQKKQRTIMLMTHDMVEADALCDLIAIIDQGKIIALGTPQELKARFGGENILEITFKTDEDLEVSINKIKALPFVHSCNEFRPGTYRLSFQGDMANFVKILQELDTSLQKVENLAFHQTTLEDVFLNLTGRELRE
ncbi:MAG: ATP-binding cassette domain-containing protein [Promethearchaeota archaeon]|nr:MAG: ATP-binding cassette domain-containing protein [Candidatus Lokiarchaeota archaeon]